MTSTLIIIPAAYRDTLNPLIANHPAFPAATPQEFAVPLFPASDALQETETHYWLAHRFTPEQRQTITGMQASFPLAQVFDYDMNDNASFPAGKLAEIGLVTRRSDGI